MNLEIRPHPHLAGVTADGREVFYTMRWCNRIRREFLLTLDKRGIFAESRAEKDPDALRFHFDVRDLPAEFIPADNYQGRNRGTYELIERPVVWAIKAIDAGVDPVACTQAAWVKAGSEAAA